MLLDEIVEGTLRIIGRFMAYLFVEIIIELILKGPGYLIAKYVVFARRKDVDYDSWHTWLMGILFWLIVIISAVYIF